MCRHDANTHNRLPALPRRQRPHLGQPVIAELGDDVETLTIDLPGFGGAAAAPGSTVTEMVDAVATQVRDAELASWILVGHSMGAKVSCVLARRAEDGAAGLDGLAGLVLIAGFAARAGTHGRGTSVSRCSPGSPRTRPPAPSRRNGFIEDNVSGGAATRAARHRRRGRAARRPGQVARLAHRRQQRGLGRPGRHIADPGTDPGRRRRLCSRPQGASLPHGAPLRPYPPGRPPGCQAPAAARARRTRGPVDPRSGLQ